MYTINWCARGKELYIELTAMEREIYLGEQLTVVEKKIYQEAETLHLLRSQVVKGIGLKTNGLRFVCSNYSKYVFLVFSQACSLPIVFKNGNHFAGVL